MFEESGFEVYESRKSFIKYVKYVQMEEQKRAKNQRIAVVKLTERMCNRYWSVKEMGDVKRLVGVKIFIV
ncbi:16370_t:CDS:2 [Cetraspora pellucida]|uniref:16370_t:CDS:1 n=1 Tax=Cetraspora pellucida TaxID=1433469 RepID=A0A9N9A1W1_9GLOM|nr:16370_t:CDS:2 [Cetraspora pellucida]